MLCGLLFVLNLRHHWKSESSDLPLQPGRNVAHLTWTWYPVGWTGVWWDGPPSPWVTALWLSPPRDLWLQPPCVPHLPEEAQEGGWGTAAGDGSLTHGNLQKIPVSTSYSFSTGGLSLPLLDKRVLIALGTCGESHGRGSELYLWKEQGENVPPIRWTLNFWLLLWCSRMCSPLPEGGFCSIWAANRSEELPATNQWGKSICALPHWLYSNANQMKPACARH